MAIRIVIVGDCTQDRHCRRTISYLIDDVCRNRVVTHLILAGPVNVRPEIRIHTPSGRSVQAPRKICGERHISQVQGAVGLSERRMPSMRIRLTTYPYGLPLGNESAWCCTRAPAESL